MNGDADVQSLMHRNDNLDVENSKTGEETRVLCSREELVAEKKILLTQYWYLVGR